MKSVAFTIFALGFSFSFLCCNDVEDENDENEINDENREPSCKEVTEHWCELCFSDNVDNCSVDMETGMCGLDCNPSFGFLDCVMNATTCLKANGCRTEYAGSPYGNVSSSCEDLCALCNHCYSTYPAFSESDCGGGDEFSSDWCQSACEADETLKQALSALSKPISQFSCCEFDVVF